MKYSLPKINSNWLLGKTYSLKMLKQKVLMIERVDYIRRTKDAATQAVCAGNARGC